MPHEDRVKAALTGLKGASPDAQIAERTAVNKLVSGTATPPTGGGAALEDPKGWEKAKRKAGIVGNRTQDINLQVPLAELMARAKAIK